MQLEGIFCPVVTPFIGTNPALELLEENIEKLHRTKLYGYVLLGSSGETPFLTKEEKLDLIRTARRAVRDNETLIVGSGLESTFTTIEFTKEVADLGADYALVLTPHYYKPQLDTEAFRQHYEKVADESPIPIILYNVPSFTGVDLPATAIIELSEHDNISGIKDSTPSFAKLTELINQTAKSFSILIGNAGLYYPGMLSGAQGAVLALCNIAPQLCVDIFKFCRMQDYDKAREQYLRSLLLLKGVLSHGIPAIKVAMDLLGYNGGLSRSPFLTPDDGLKKEIEGHLKRAELL